MTKYWYCIPHKNEVGSYNESEGITDFNRGILLAYGNCCLTTGFKTEQEAREWMKNNKCEK